MHQLDRPPGGGRLAVILLAAVICAASGRAEIIDRIVASVAGELIMLSDVRAFITFNLVEVKAVQDPDEAVLERLIERWLILDEVERYLVAEPPSSGIGEQMAEIRRRFGSEARFRAALANVGFTEEDLAQVLRENERMRAYLNGRFASAGQPTEEEVRAYYQQHRDEFARGGRLLSFESVRDAVREKVVAEGRARLITDWVTGLRRRAIILRMDRQR